MLKPHEREWNAEKSLKKCLEAGYSEEDWLRSVDDGKTPKMKVIESLGFSLSDAIDMVALYRGEV